MLGNIEGVNNALMQKHWLYQLEALNGKATRCIKENTMKKIQEINSVINPNGFEMCKVVSCERYKGAGRHQYRIVCDVTAGYYQRDDGEMTAIPAMYAIRYNFNTVKDVSLEQIQSLIAQKMECDTYSEAVDKLSKARKKRQKEVDEISEKHEFEKVEMEKRVERAKEPVNPCELKSRLDKTREAIDASEDEKLKEYAKMNTGTLLSDSYRQEFLELVNSPIIRGLVADLLAYKDPMLILDQQHFMITLNKECRKRGLEFRTLGGPINAVRYLVQSGNM